MARVGGLALAAACAGALLIPAPASAGPTVPYCTQLQKLQGCTAPALPSPANGADPGGSETVAQPVPKAGKRFGFSSNLSFQIAANMRHPVTAGQEAELARTAGADSARISASWKYLQYNATDPLFGATRLATDRPEVQALDARYDELVARGMTPVIHGHYAPKWASRFGNCAVTDLDCRQYATQHGWDDYYFPDAAHIPHWKAFMDALTRRYPLAVIEGWNEPNLYYGDQSAAWIPWTPGPEEFKAIHCAAHDAVKAADPQRIVVGPSFIMNGPARYDFVNRVFHAQGDDCWDVYNTHVYFNGQSTFGADSTFAWAINGVRNMKASYGDADPIWITETGWATGGTGWESPVSEAVQADAAGRLYNKAMSLPDVTGLFFHTLRDAPNVGQQNTDDIERYYGFLREAFTPKPAYCVFVIRSAHTYSGC